LSLPLPPTHIMSILALQTIKGVGFLSVIRKSAANQALQPTVIFP
jgi:hypothetical protein